VTDPADLTHAVLLKVAEFIRKLPSDQLADLAEGSAKLELVPLVAGRRPGHVRPPSRRYRRSGYAPTWPRSVTPARPASTCST